jgi:hypothetical protein
MYTKKYCRLHASIIKCTCESHRENQVNPHRAFYIRVVRLVRGRADFPNFFVHLLYKQMQYIQFAGACSRVYRVAETYVFLLPKRSTSFGKEVHRCIHATHGGCSTKKICILFLFILNVWMGLCQIRQGWVYSCDAAHLGRPCRLQAYAQHKSCIY